VKKISNDPFHLESKNKDKEQNIVKAKEIEEKVIKRKVNNQNNYINKEPKIENNNSYINNNFNCKFVNDMKIEELMTCYFLLTGKTIRGSKNKILDKIDKAIDKMK
jgi:CRISPR/Cas system CSM-associated protein Csm4 (group 5 of RAMP superfamily)